MFPVLDHIDTLIAADFYEENNQPFLSEAMKLLNRPNLEFWFMIESLFKSIYNKNTFNSKSFGRAKNIRLPGSVAMTHNMTYWCSSRSKSLNNHRSYCRTKTSHVYVSRSRSSDVFKHRLY